MRNSSRNAITTARWINALFAGVLIGTCVLSQTDQPGPPCLFKATFHLPCPGCGITRSFKAIWRGDWTMAMRYHPLGLLFFGLSVVFLCLALFQKPLVPTPLALPKAHQWLLEKRTIVTLTALLLGVWAVRLCLLLADHCGLHNSMTRFLIS